MTGSVFGAAPTGYMSVKEAIREQANVRRLHRVNQPASVRLPPVWGEVHAKEAANLTPRKHTVGFPRAEDALFQPSMALTTSYASSVGPGPQTPRSPKFRPGSTTQSALGGSSKSGLNHTSTYVYGENPIKPLLCSGNQYNTVGSNSMFGSQAVSDRASSGAFGFGTSTREQLMNTYISPAHLKGFYGKFSPSPNRYTLQSSLGRQVLDSKTSYPSSSFGLEDRFDADRRDQRATQTPGPGAYRV